MGTHEIPVYAYRRPPELDHTEARRVPVVVAGGGPVGLAAAIDLVLQGIHVVLLEEDDTLSSGSKAICWSKRTLEIFDRLGCAAPIVERGITWNRGKVFFRDRQVFQFDLQPEPGHRFPAFVNLQQYLVEQVLVERAEQLDGVELRWRNRVLAVAAGDDGVTLEIGTPDGRYRLACDYLVAADGVRSHVRRALGLDFKGQVFNDQFLIADVSMKAEFPTERWFWFDPPFHGGHSALLHRQADDVWRIDLQLGADADPEEERRPERVVPRIRQMLGESARFELEWVSVYTFQCRRLDRFRHGRVIFVGDSAHQVSPFGARGGNGGIQDSDNLAWKLALVIRGLAPESLLDSYDAERIPAADENILASTRATDFITPKSAASRALRDAVLELAETCPFARRMVNSGRLSVPAVLHGSPLSTPDEDRFEGAMVPGAPALDAPLADRRWLLGSLQSGFTLLHFPAAGGAPIADPPAKAVAVPGDEASALARERYDAAAGAVYLMRPDQHVAARWRRWDATRVRAALARAMGGVE